jgi:hypothetical protein
VYVYVCVNVSVCVCVCVCVSNMCIRNQGSAMLSVPGLWQKNSLFGHLSSWPVIWQFPDVVRHLWSHSLRQRGREVWHGASLPANHGKANGNPFNLCGLLDRGKCHFLKKKPNIELFLFYHTISVFSYFLMFRQLSPFKHKGWSTVGGGYPSCQLPA